MESADLQDNGGVRRGRQQVLDDLLEIAATLHSVIPVKTGIQTFYFQEFLENCRSPKVSWIPAAACLRVGGGGNDES
ncbi:hypothetical protein [Neisseria oralis]|uniref:hypothetical protein n=1 Tax=Neisseria oralis TaxID=1107316 RepID=UPI0027E03BF0|nr:hypothetical protein [Neisseria oralis]